MHTLHMACRLGAAPETHGTWDAATSGGAAERNWRVFVLDVIKQLAQPRGELGRVLAEHTTAAACQGLPATRAARQCIDVAVTEEPPDQLLVKAGGADSGQPMVVDVTHLAAGQQWIENVVVQPAGSGDLG